ncbi:MAG: hypothetical protein DMG02_01430, partial [Acidobacteria bacterium]
MSFRGVRGLCARGEAAFACSRRSDLHRVCGRDRSRLHACQRRDRQLLPAGDDGRRRRALRLRQRRRPRRVPRSGWRA